MICRTIGKISYHASHPIVNSKKSHSAGEEVFDSYGCNLSPTDLLLDYGFVDPHNTNHRTQINPYEIGG